MAKIIEIDGDIISCPPEYYMIDFIPADQAVDEGLMPRQQPGVSLVGHALFSEKTFKLITKEHYRDTTQYYSLRVALISLRDRCYVNDIRKLALQKIGYGLNRLDWQQVLGIIEGVFNHMDIEILVYSGLC